MDYRILDIFLPDPEGFLAPAHVEGYDLELASRFRVRVGEGIVGAAAAAREPVFVPDVSKDPRYIPFFPGVVAELAIPLVSKDHLVGVLNIEGPAAAPFTPAARTALQVLAGHLAVAIENATLYRETRWYAGLLATLYEIGKETASILDLDELLQRLAEIVKRVIDYEMFGILLLDEERDELVLRKAVNFGPARERSRLPVTEGLCGAAVRSPRAGPRRRRAEGPALREPRPGDPLRARGAARAQGPGDRRLRPRVAGARPLHRAAREGAHPAREPGGGGDRERAALRRDPEERGAAGARAADRPRHPARALPRGLALRGGLGGLGPLPPRPRARGRPLRLLRHGRRPPRRRDRRRGGQGRPGRALRGVRLGHVRARAFERRAPADLMQRVNRTLRRRGIEGLFCTLAYALFDFQDRTLRVANSGLPHPLHYRAAERRAAPLEVSGLPLGTFDGVSYDEVTVELAKGDVVVFYTDGLVEARRGREEYGPERLLGGSRPTRSSPPPSSGSGSSPTSRASSGTKAPADDVTLIVVKVL